MPEYPRTLFRMYGRLLDGHRRDRRQCSIGLHRSCARPRVPEQPSVFRLQWELSSSRMYLDSPAHKYDLLGPTTHYKLTLHPAGRRHFEPEHFFISGWPFAESSPTAKSGLPHRVHFRKLRLRRSAQRRASRRLMRLHPGARSRHLPQITRTLACSLHSAGCETRNR